MAMEKITLISNTSLQLNLAERDQTDTHLCSFDPIDLLMSVLNPEPNATTFRGRPTGPRLLLRALAIIGSGFTINGQLPLLGPGRRSAAGKQLGVHGCRFLGRPRGAVPDRR